MTAVAALQFHSVFKNFPDRRGGRLEVLQNITFDVLDREVVAVLGPSGCGKSTLLHIAAGLSAPDRGSISLFGNAPGNGNDWHAVRYMFQDDRLLPWRSALANVELALERRPLGHAERRKRATNALERVGLAGFLHALPNELSGGMRSRVTLARSFVTQPRLLLMDEPFSRLDSDTRAAMHALFLELREETGAAVVIVTHDAGEAAKLSGKIIRMSRRPANIIATSAL
ncbi:MAG TPA: ATP-binding cassette domain-containing protein [Aliidongia sp.]|uniref:ABC transporter ATP-binding protein n=1 Tax=Aliidongia sp. TaxID=1914230 RepID=UPI002DDD1EEB|nr:ATP-binding cassette domain-containing protein [Aliidongia sp.]HEV2677517.1 ATP-binding cassette domain-containing protein [Aliidongia sp.]